MALALTVKVKTASPVMAADNAYQPKWSVGRIKGLIEFALLAVGAVAGAYLRYSITDSPNTFGGLPVNVLIVNVIGSFILGVFSVLTLALNFDAKYGLMVAVGFCGSYTTMSSFALETSNLLENNSFSLAALNVLANVGLSLGAVIAGRAMGNLVLERILQ